MKSYSEIEDSYAIELGFEDWEHLCEVIPEYRIEEHKDAVNVIFHQQKRHFESLNQLK